MLARLKSLLFPYVAGGLLATSASGGAYVTSGSNVYEIEVFQRCGVDFIQTEKASLFQQPTFFRPQLPSSGNDVTVSIKLLLDETGHLVEATVASPIQSLSASETPKRLQAI